MPTRAARDHHGAHAAEDRTPTLRRSRFISVCSSRTGGVERRVGRESDPSEDPYQGLRRRDMVIAAIIARVAAPGEGNL